MFDFPVLVNFLLLVVVPCLVIVRLLVISPLLVGLSVPFLVVFSAPAITRILTMRT